jgi:hypothetical protein
MARQFMKTAQPFFEDMLMLLVLGLSIESEAAHGNAFAQKFLVDLMMVIPFLSHRRIDRLFIYLTEIVSPTIVEIILMKLLFSPGAKRHSQIVNAKFHSLDSINIGPESNAEDEASYFELLDSLLRSLNSIIFAHASGLDAAELFIFQKYKQRSSEGAVSSGNIGVDKELLFLLDRLLHNVRVGGPSTAIVVSSSLNISQGQADEQSTKLLLLSSSSSSSSSSSAAAAAAAVAAFLSPPPAAALLSSTSTTTSAPATTTTSVSSHPKTKTKRTKVDSEDGAISRRKFYNGTFVLVNTLAHHSKRARITEGWADFNDGKGRYVMRYKFVILKENGEPSTSTDNAWEFELGAIIP